jgi:tRNA(adenine34) deaminase
VGARDLELMAEALAEAQLSLDVDEFPVGAVLVLNNEVVARGHWKGVIERRLLDHAEMVVLLDAERSGRVTGWQDRQAATLYTTLEPCALCMAASMSFLLGRIVFAARAPLDGGTNLPELWKPPNGHPADGIPYTIPSVTGGIGSDESTRLIAEWTGRDPATRGWALSYLPSASKSATT